MKYASIYDSFTITVLMQLEDLGFCKKGEGGKFVADGNLISGVGKLPFNTDGGGLCNNHPVQPRRHDQDSRGRAPAARRSASQGAGAELRSRHGHGTGGSLGTAPRRRDRHHGKRVEHGHPFPGRKISDPLLNPGDAGLLRRRRKASCWLRSARACVRGAPLSADHLPILLERPMSSGSRRRARARSIPTVSCARARCIAYAIGYRRHRPGRRCRAC
jgi:hypothetical protein